MFKIDLPQSGMSYDCKDDETVLDGAMRAGLEFPYSCRSGVCGSCEGDVVAGEYAIAGRTGDDRGHCGPSERVKLCRVKPCSDMVLHPREVRKLDPNAHKTVKAKVYKIAKAASEVMILKLRFPAGTRVKFKAGQYLKVMLDNGEERSFSMANPPHQNDGVELHIRYLKGGLFSELLFNSVKAGDTLTVRLPFGDFYLRKTEAPIVFVVGGTGFAPVKSIIEDMKKNNVRRPVHLYFGARTPELLYMNDLCNQWAQDIPDFSYIPVVSDALQDWNGRSGLVHNAVLEDLPNLAGHEVYACGAPGMITAAREAFENIGGMAHDAFFADAYIPAMELAPSVIAEAA